MVICSCGCFCCLCVLLWCCWCGWDVGWRFLVIVCLCVFVVYFFIFHWLCFVSLSCLSLVCVCVWVIFFVVDSLCWVFFLWWWFSYICLCVFFFFLLFVVGVCGWVWWLWGLRVVFGWWLGNVLGYLDFVYVLEVVDGILLVVGIVFIW